MLGANYKKIQLSCKLQYSQRHLIIEQKKMKRIVVLTGNHILFEND